jgi:pilus assembly protein CpaB
MRRTASVTILLIALTFGAFAAFLARSWLQSHSERTAVKEESTIVVAIRPLAFGTPITPDDVREAPWPADSKPEGSFAKASDLLKDGRRIVLSPFVRDEPIVAAKVGAPTKLHRFRPLSRRASAPSPSPSTMSAAWRDSYSRATLSMSF